MMLRKLLCAVVCVAVGSLAAAHAETILIDDFNDGNADGWTRFDNLNMGGGPGVFDVLPEGDPGNFAYNIRSTGPVPPIFGANSIASTWDISLSDAIYSNGLISAKVRNNVDKTDVVLGMRANTETGSSYHAYYFILSNFFAEPRAFLGKQLGTEFSFFQTSDVSFPFDKFIDWNIEAGVVGNQLSMKVWRDGDPEPTTPQLMATDPTPLPEGGFGLLTWSGTANTSSLPLDATIDDIYFTLVSPADFNLDLTVDAQDLDIWQNGYGSPGQREDGDADGDGLVTGKDFLIWQREYVAEVSGLAAELGIPEPSTLLMGVLAFAGLGRRRPA